MAIKSNLSKAANAGRKAFGVTNSYIGRLDTATTKFQPWLRRGSIIDSAKDNVFEFPVFISNSVPLDYATATTSLLEQTYASYLQMALSVNPVIDSDMATNGLQFADFKTDTNKYLEYTDMDYAHDACHAMYVNEECLMEFNMLSIEDSDARVINEYAEYDPLSEFSHYFQEAAPQRETLTNDDVSSSRNAWDDNGVGSYSVNYPSEADRKQAEENLHNIQMRNKQLEDQLSDENQQYEKDIKEIEKDKIEAEKDLAKLKRDLQKADDNEKKRYQAEIKKAQKDADLAEKKLNDYDADHKKQQEKIQGEIDKNKKEMSKLDEDIKNLRNRNRDYDDDRKMTKERHAHDVRVAAPTMLDESKIQKLNTMKPLMMSVELRVKDKNGTLSTPVNYVVGVKCHNRLIDSEILPEVAQYPLKEMDKLSRKAKWKAGELKFLKDIVFRIKQKKQTAVDSKDPRRKWYRRLYELAHMKGDAPAAAVAKGDSLFAHFVFDKQGKGTLRNGVLPNATMIFTKADIDNIKSQTNIDLLDGDTASSFCQELFLISFVVIDIDAESIKMLLPDLHNDFEIHSLASVNKQLATLDTAGTKTRDMFKLLG